MTHREQVFRNIEARKAQSRAADISAMMETEWGRRIFGAIIEASGIFQKAPANAQELAEWTGRRGLGLDIWQAFFAEAPGGCLRALAELNAMATKERRDLDQAAEEDRKEGVTVWPWQENEEDKQ